MDRRPTITVSVSPVLLEQVREIAEQDQATSLSAFAAELLRLGLAAYCEQSNKIHVNLNLRKKSY